MKVILFMAVSLNGIIADKHGKEDFLSHENWTSFIEVAKEFGNFIYGHNTYEAVNEWGQEYVDDLSEIATKIVISKTLDTASNGFEIARSSSEAIKIIESKGHDIVLLTGGARNNSYFGKLGLIDEVLFNIEPAIIGDGIPVFSPEDFTLKLELIEQKMINEKLLQLHYRVIR